MPCVGGLGSGHPLQLRHLKAAAALATSALAYYFSTGLEGHWLPIWLAPVPLLVLACQLPGRSSLVLALAVYLLGSLNMVAYLARARKAAPKTLLKQMEESGRLGALHAHLREMKTVTHIMKLALGENPAEAKA